MATWELDPRNFGSGLNTKLRPPSVLNYHKTLSSLHLANLKFDETSPLIRCFEERARKPCTRNGCSPMVWSHGDNSWQFPAHESWPGSRTLNILTGRHGEIIQDDGSWRSLHRAAAGGHEAVARLLLHRKRMGGGLAPIERPETKIRNVGGHHKKKRHKKGHEAYPLGRVAPELDV